MCCVTSLSLTCSSAVVWRSLPWRWNALGPSRQAVADCLVRSERSSCSFQHITERPSRYIFGTEFLLMSQTPVLAGASVEKDCLLITDIALRSVNVQMCCGHLMDDNIVCGVIIGPSCAFYRALHGSSFQMTMWHYSPAEAAELSPSVIGLNGFDVDDRVSVRVHAVIQEACISCICTCVADRHMNRL